MYKNEIDSACLIPIQTWMPLKTNLMNNNQTGSIPNGMRLIRCSSFSLNCHTLPQLLLFLCLLVSLKNSSPSPTLRRRPAGPLHQSGLGLGGGGISYLVDGSKPWQNLTGCMGEITMWGSRTIPPFEAKGSERRTTFPVHQSSVLHQSPPR